MNIPVTVSAQLEAVSADCMLSRSCHGWLVHGEGLKEVNSSVNQSDTGQIGNKAPIDSTSAETARYGVT